MGYWGYTFPLATLSIVTMDYYEHVHSDLVQAMSYLSVMLVTFVVAMCAIHTLILLQKRWDIFVPNEKWSPLSFMKVIHFGLRGAVRKLERSVPFPSYRRCVGEKLSPVVLQLRPVPECRR